MTPEDATRDASGRRRPWWVAAAQWRNWPLLVKLSMVLVVPVVAALVLGVLRVRADVGLSNSYSDVERIATIRAGLVEVLANIQRERNFAVVQNPGGSEAYNLQAGETDVIINDFNEKLRLSPDLGDAGTTGRRELTKAIDSLKPIREHVTRGTEWFVVISEYGSVIDAVLDFDRALVGRFPDRELSGISAALYDMQVAREQVSLQEALTLVGLRTGSLNETQRDMFVEADVRLWDRVGDIKVVAPPELYERYDTIVSGDHTAARESMVLSVKAHGTISLGFSAQDWTSASDVTASLMTNVARSAAADLQAASSRLQDSVSNRAGAQAVLLLVIVLLVGGIGGVLGRYLVRSVRVLHRSALEVAHRRLPEAVAAIRAGEGAAAAAIEPVPLHTTEEFGQLARAFDAVNGQAVRSAAEEASLRSNLRNIFVNLSRRSQGLVERQLRLMEQLEQRADDPEALANLFKLDHLATRMRRNNENLMVLSGMDLGRRVSEPMPLPDVLRAAVSEVEHYQRAIVRSAPLARIIGYAAGDLIRSVAELVENATAFSPPTTQVIITSRVTEGGFVLIDILDQGIGMGEEELREANERVAAGGGVDVPVSRQMGLFVVGSLTARHGIRVRLAKRTDGEPGLQASLLVPADLVVGEGEPAPSNAAPAPVPEPEPVLVAAGGGVTDLLESAGIFVTLPDVPAATSPASILFAPRTPVGDSAPTEFTWLSGGSPKGKHGAAPVTLAAPVTMPTQQGPGGLPKRVPQAQLLTGQERGNGTPRPGPRDAARARGFLSSFQAGIRRVEENGKGEGST